MLVGYVRVSTEEQNTARQDELMKQLNAEKVFVDKASGKNANREQLKAMMNFVREGDTVIVSEIARFARHTRDFLNLMDELKEKGVKFVSQKENIDTSTPTGQFMLTVFAAMAELERETILARQREGIAVAKSQGKYKGRQPIKYDEDKFARLYKKWKSGEITAVKMADDMGMTRQTFYRRVKEYEGEKVNY